MVEPAASPLSFVRVIISGGQTGADRAALDAAIELGIPHGGWVPLGRRAEDGPLPPCYHLREMPSAKPAVRTRWNVRDADATVIFSHGPLSGGSALTLRLAIKLAKPVLHLDLKQDEESVARDRLRQWLSQHRPAVLNVAGPRLSQDQAIYEPVKRILTEVFRDEDQGMPRTGVKG